MNKLVYENRELTYKEIIWQELKKRSRTYKDKLQSGEYRNSRLEMAYFLAKEGDYHRALEYLSELVYYDLSILYNDLDDNFLDSYIKNVFKYNQSRLKIGPGIIDLIVAYQKELGLRDDELEKLILDQIENLRSEVEIFTDKECVEIFFKERYNKLDELEEIYKKAEIRYRTNNGDKKISKL